MYEFNNYNNIRDILKEIENVLRVLPTEVIHIIIGYNYNQKFTGNLISSIKTDFTQYSIDKLTILPNNNFIVTRSEIPFIYNSILDIYNGSLIDFQAQYGSYVAINKISNNGIVILSSYSDSILWDMYNNKILTKNLKLGDLTIILDNSSLLIVTICQTDDRSHPIHANYVISILEYKSHVKNVLSILLEEITIRNLIALSNNKFILTTSESIYLFTYDPNSQTLTYKLFSLDSEHVKKYEIKNSILTDDGLLFWSTISTPKGSYHKYVILLDLNNFSIKHHLSFDHSSYLNEYDLFDIIYFEIDTIMIITDRIEIWNLKTNTKINTLMANTGNADLKFCKISNDYLALYSEKLASNSLSLKIYNTKTWDPCFIKIPDKISDLTLSNDGLLIVAFNNSTIHVYS